MKFRDGDYDVVSNDESTWSKSALLTHYLVIQESFSRGYRVLQSGKRVLRHTTDGAR